MSTNCRRSLAAIAALPLAGCAAPAPVVPVAVVPVAAGPVAVVPVRLLPSNVQVNAIANGGSEVVATRNLTVASGGTLRVGFFASVNPDCTRVEGASLQLTSEPANGVTTIKPTQSFAYFPPANPRSACNAKRVAGELMEYRPNPGFVGEDHFGFTRYTVEGRAVREDVVVHVQ